jgi:hypothetical protein
MSKEKILKELERVKWFLWHGNVFRADETLTDLMFEVDGAIEEDREARRPAQLVLKKLARALEEFGTYIDNNASGIVNYGERHRCGERISTGFVESTINQLVAKRFVKKQQMRWTPRGAHLLLQLRVQALNDDLHTTFERWYPDLRRRHEETSAASHTPNFRLLSIQRRMISSVAGDTQGGRGWPPRREIGRAPTAHTSGRDLRAR